MNTFKAIYDKQKSKGVFNISLVEAPAMEGFFVALKDEKIQLAEVDKEKRILIGLVLEPNKLIPRRAENGEYFNLVFEENTITELAHDFVKNGFVKDSSLEHEKKILGVSVVESWIVENEKADKSALYKLNLKKGSWCVVMKIHNDDIWNNYIKAGKVKGFSIDAFLKLENFNYNTNMSKISEVITKSVADFITKLTAQPVQLGTVKSAEGVDISYEGEELQVGSVLFIETEAGRTEVLAGSYPLEDGRVITVDDSSIVTEISDAPAPAEPMPDEETLKALINKELEKYKSELSALKVELEELKKQPASKPIGNPAKQSIINYINRK